MNFTEEEKSFVFSQISPLFGRNGTLSLMEARLHLQKFKPALQKTSETNFENSPLEIEDNHIEDYNYNGEEFKVIEIVGLIVKELQYIF